MRVDSRRDDEGKVGSLTAQQLVPALLLLAVGFGFYSVREHRELQKQEEALRAKDREEAELKERVQVLESEQEKIKDTTEMRLAGEQQAAIAKEAAEKIAAEQQRVQLERQNALLRGTLDAEKQRLESMKKRRESLRTANLDGNAANLDSRIRQSGEDVRSYEERVKNYRASVLTQQGTQKQKLAELRFNYESELARVRQSISEQEFAIKATQNSQNEWKARRTDYSRPAKLKELGDQLNAQRETLAGLKNQITALKNAEHLDTVYIQSQINASGDLAKRAGQDEPEANRARVETANLKAHKSRLDEQASFNSKEIRNLDEQIKTQKARIRELEAALAKKK